MKLTMTTSVLLAASLAAQTVTVTPPKRITGDAPARTGPGLISKTMATLDAQSFATALAEAGHPAGFIMPTAERQGMLPSDSGERLTLDEAIAAFTARGRYRADKHGAVTVFTHVSAPADVTNALATRREHYPIKATFALALYDQVLRGLARRPMGGFSQREPGASAACPVENAVSIPGGRATYLETLNALVARTKGVSWTVRFGAPGERLRLQVGYVCGNGVWSALSVPGW